MTESKGVPLLRVEDLRTWFPINKGLFRHTVGWIRAVDGLCLEIEAGQTLALVGESGCGKTTVGRSILRLEKPQQGRVFFDGKELLGLSSEELQPLRRHAQFVFQDPMASLNPRMRVLEIISEGMKSFGVGANAKARKERVAQLLERVQLDPDAMWRYPHEFSGGQRQRIGIARALAPEPRLLICDEAVSALDVSIQAQILNLLRRLQEDLGLSYLFITHDLGVVRYLAHEVAVMYLGQIVEVGPTERIFEDPRHPYTKALLSAIPSMDPARRGVTVPVLGDVPSPSNPPDGCRFHTRCPLVFERCRRDEPGLVSLYDSQREEGVGASRCFLSQAQPDARG